MLIVKHTDNATNIEYTQSQKTITTLETKYCISTNQPITNNNTSIANRVVIISPQEFITNIEYFKNLCNLDEDEAVIQLKDLFYECSKAQIREWLDMRFKSTNRYTSYTPIEYSVFHGMIKMTKQLLKSFEESRYSILEYMYYEEPQKRRGWSKKLFYNINIANILTKSLIYHDLELTTELIKFYEKDESISFHAFYSLVIGSINQDQINILQLVLERYYNIMGYHLGIKKGIQDTDITKLEPMQLAISKGNYKIVELLLKYNFKADAFFYQKNTVFLAFKSNNFDIIKLLVNNVVDLNKVIYKDVKSHKIFPFLKDVTEVSLEEHNRNHGNYIRVYKSRLEQAVECCNVKIILWLIENGAKSLSLNLKEQYHLQLLFTPLHLAIFLNRPEVVAALLATKVVSFEDKAWFSLQRNPIPDNNTLCSITARDYIFKLNDGKDRSEIISMLDNPLPLLYLSKFKFIRYLIKNDILHQLEKIKNCYELPRKII